ncbi:MAG: sulfatase [Lentisphaeria bacterium]|nr:sulfatase [Lentisphaeria bacterium]
MKQRGFFHFLCLSTAFLAAGGSRPLGSAEVARPNILLIVCDDLNDYVTGYGGHPQARTPHLERLAETGVAFTRAYSNNPICAPSRSSFLTGIYPHVSRNHSFSPWYSNPVLKNSRTLMDCFKQNGYQVIGTGKVMHHHRAEEWTEFKHKADYGPFWHRGGERVAHPGVREPYASIGPVDGSFGALEDAPGPGERAEGEGWVYGVWGEIQPLRCNGPDDRDPTPDERNAAWAAERIRELARTGLEKPFFLAVGFIRPHTPLHVPRKYFDLFPAARVELPVLRAGDVEDTWLASVVDQESKGFKYFRLLRESYPGDLEGLRAFARAYLASVAAVDDCIGEVVDALDGSPFRDNTIVVVTSDHGWSMGQKDWVFKNSLWEESCRVPLIIRAPGVARVGGRAGHPVSLIDLYPTLVDLCRLEGPTRKNDRGAPLDGHSLRPFLKDPENGRWDGPDAVLTMVCSGGSYSRVAEMQHYSLRSRDFRYIRYNNGKEELYDHRGDPHEWTNVAERGDYAAIREQLRRRLDAMTGLTIGTPPPATASPLGKGERLAFDFEEFDPEWEIMNWPAHHRATITRDPARVIGGQASLQLHSPGSPWNVVHFENAVFPPGLSCSIRFDCRALKTVEGGFLYFILQQDKAKSRLVRVPLAEGEQKTVTDTLVNDQDVPLRFVIGFAQGGTYVIDNLELVPEGARGGGEVKP